MSTDSQAGLDESMQPDVMDGWVAAPVMAAHLGIPRHMLDSTARRGEIDHVTIQGGAYVNARQALYWYLNRGLCELPDGFLSLIHI